MVRVGLSVAWLTCLVTIVNIVSTDLLSKKIVIREYLIWVN